MHFISGLTILSVFRVPASCCQSRIDKTLLPYTTVEDMQYSIQGYNLGLNANRSKRSDINSPGESRIGESKFPCIKALPGTQILLNGINPFIMAVGAHEFGTLYSQLFQYSCSNTTFSKDGYSKPMEIEEMEDVSKNDFLEKDFRRDGFIDYLLQTKICASMDEVLLRELLSIKLKKELSIKLVQLSWKNKYIRFSDKARPSAKLMKSYYELPQNYSGNEVQYYTFIRRYGTDFLTKVLMGGCIVVVVIVEGNYTAKPVIALPAPDILSRIDNVLHSPNTFLHKITLCKGGNLLYTKSVRTWVNSLRFDPVVLEGKGVPLNVFVEAESENISTRSASFSAARANEIDFGKLQKIRIRIQLTDINEKIKTMLLAVVEKDLQYVIPNPQLLSLFEDMIKDNPTLNKYFLKCFHPKRQVGIIQMISKFHLITNVCVSTFEKLPYCEKMEYDYPSQLCVVLYFQRSCMGSGLTFFYANAHQIQTQFHDFLSFKLSKC